MTSNPDVPVNPHVVLQAEKQWNATGTGDFGRFGGGMAQATQSTVPIGTLAVTMSNPKTGELIWRGAAQDQVSTSGAITARPAGHPGDLQELPAGLGRQVGPSVRDFFFRQRR